MNNSLPALQELDDDLLMDYLQNFLDINTFKNIANGKELLSAIRDNPDHPKIKTIVRKVLALFQTDAPGAKVCTLQFLKEAMETNSWEVVEAVQKTLLPKVAQVIEYRPHIRSLQRGSSYFITSFDKDEPDQEISNLIKLSSTFFRMIHECIYVWGALYFPNSSFDRMRIKLMKRFDFPRFPEEFKFYTDKKIENFKQNCQDAINKMTQYNEEVISRSSVQKKRETSLKTSRTDSNLISKHSRSQSTQQLNQPKANAKNKKRQEQQLNMKKIRAKDKKKENQKKREVQKKQPEASLSNSSLLRKKNSFNEALLDTQLQHESKSNSEQDSKSKSSKPKIKEQKTKQNRFKTISEQQDSEGGRYSMKQSIVQSSQQFSDLNYIYEDRANQSPRSQLKNQRDKIALKKYISQQITKQIPKNQSSLNQNKLSQINQQPQKKQPKSIPPKDTNKNKKLLLERQKATKQKDLSQKQTQKEKQTLSNQKDLQKKTKVNNGKQGKTNIAIVPKLPLPVQSKGHQDKRKRRDQSARKKFVTSEQQNSHKQTQHQNVEKQSQDQPSQIVLKVQSPPKEKVVTHKTNVKQNAEKIPKNQNSKQQHNHYRSAQNTVQEKQTKKNEQQVVQKPIKMAKPQKIKGTGSGKTVFQGKEYSIIETISQSKPVQKVLENQINTKNKPISPKKVEATAKESVNSKDIYKIAELIEDNDLITIELKKNTPESKVQKNKVNQIDSDQSKQSSKEQTIEGNKKRQIPVIVQKKRQILEKEVKQNDLRQEKQEYSTKHYVEINRINEAHYQKTQNPATINSIQTIQQNLTQTVPDSGRISVYSPRKQELNELPKKNLQNPIYSYRQTLRQTQQTSVKYPNQDRQKSYSRSRLRKQQQVNLAIHPHDQSLSELQARSRYDSVSQVKDMVRNQITQEFEQFKSALLQQQQENIHQSIQLYADKFKTQARNVETAVDFGIQTKIRQKQKSRAISKRRYKMFDQSVEAKDQKNSLNSQNISVGQVNVINTHEIQTAKHFNQSQQPKGLKSRGNSKNRTNSSAAEYQPNTLLYALLRKRSLVQ